MSTTEFLDLQEGLWYVLAPVLHWFLAVLLAGGVFAALVSFFLETNARWQRGKS